MKLYDFADRTKLPRGPHATGWLLYHMLYAKTNFLKAHTHDIVTNYSVVVQPLHVLFLCSVVVVVVFLFFVFVFCLCFCFLFCFVLFLFVCFLFCFVLCCNKKDSYPPASSFCREFLLNLPWPNIWWVLFRL